jgi:DNA repair ATPase RecN
MDDEKLLLCRREPQQQASTNEMLLLRGQNIIIPDQIISNTTTQQVKNMLNELFRLSFLEIDTSNNFFTARPSYRDFMAFIFQPQNIIANADVLFYKADTTEHREKLIKIFPYILGAVSPEILSAKQEIEYFTKRRDKLQKSLSNIKEVAEKWKQELHSWISQAHEFGLTNYVWNDADDFSEQVNQLRLISEKAEYESKMTSENIEEASDELVSLRKEEQDIASKLFVFQKRYTEMRQLSESINQYDKSLQIQLKRLDLSSWLRSMVTEDGVCPLCGNNHADSTDLLDDLCNAIQKIEKTAGNMQTVPVAFERELKLVKEEINRCSDQLSAIRNRINEQSGRFQTNKNRKYTLENVSRFLGKIEMAVQTYDNIGTDNELENEINNINSKLHELNRSVNDYDIKRKIDSALSYIQTEMFNSGF